MRIEADAVLRHPREAVFTAYRDDLPAFVEFLPNVRAIEVLERREEGGVVHLHNRMHGATELPAPLAQRLEERFLSWDDRARWDRSEWSCRWRISTHAFESAVRCTGRSDFIDLGGDRTRLEIGGELSIELGEVKAVPAFLAGSLGRTAERFLVRQISANLAAVADALAAYLREDTVA
ncbi:MAG TPA: hypothetical protein RMH99_29395 [Sandaracinaceae bacterium LLY-WYZ-13_1]|nr:hypothetical protein [Sandaracinaceae bacterium LLY-WYZ-13_1]